MIQSFWRKCSTCKKEIQFKAKYYVCSVSTCKSGRLALAFCSSDCWDAHLGYARHRGEAWAEEDFAPATAAAATPEPSRAPMRKIIDSTPAPASSAAVPGLPAKLETLVVVSKVKQLIKDQADFNTSQCLIDALTRKVAEAAIKAIEEAKSSGRRTVMGRDVR